jgi:hypothetical protein
MLPRPVRRLVMVVLVVLLVHILCEVSEELCVLRIFADWCRLTVPSCPIEAHGRTVSSDGDERYLIYQPQFGLSNQLIALRNAAAWAAVLNRTLVLPHLLGHLVEADYMSIPRPHRAIAKFADAFAFASDSRTLAPLKVIDMDSFLLLRLPAARLVQVETVKLSLVSVSNPSPVEAKGGLQASEPQCVSDAHLRRSRSRLCPHAHPASRSQVRDDYFQALAARGFPVVSTTAPVRLRLRKFLPKTILRAVGGCHAQRQVLALRSLFGMWDVRPGSGLPGWVVPGRDDMSGAQWLDQVVMPALLRPAAPIRTVVDSIIQSVLASAATEGTGGAGSTDRAHLASSRRGTSRGARRLRHGPAGAGGGDVDRTSRIQRSSSSSIGGAGGGVGGAPAGAPRWTKPHLHGRERSAPAVMACVHVRRGDFEEYCPKCEAEARSRSSRGWVKSHFRHGYSCIQVNALAEMLGHQRRALPCRRRACAAKGQLKAKRRLRNSALAIFLLLSGPRATTAHKGLQTPDARPRARPWQNFPGHSPTKFFCSSLVTPPCPPSACPP